MLGYNYYGSYNDAYRRYLAKVKQLEAEKKFDDKIARDYDKNAALVNGVYNIEGKVLSESTDNVLKNIIIKIKGTDIYTYTNSKGYFKIKIPKNAVLVFSSRFYRTREILFNGKADTTIKLQAVNLLIESQNILYKSSVSGVTTKGDAGLSTSVGDVGSNTLNEVYVTGYGSSNQSVQILIRGNSSSNELSPPLYVIDGIIANSSSLEPSEIAEINVLKDNSAIALYGAKAANGVVLITTKKAKSLLANQIVSRKNFNETAFFYPHLRTNEMGEIIIDFTIPETLTQWNFKGFIHTKNFKTAYIESKIITQKELSITANMPRFLRVGDSITIAATLTNLTDSALNGAVSIIPIDAITGEQINIFSKAQTQQLFKLGAKLNKAINFTFIVPDGIEGVNFKLTASSGSFSDGEEQTVPVLPNKIFITETLPMMVRPGKTASFSFDSFLKNTSTTHENKNFIIEYTHKPLWLVIQALPYLLEISNETSEYIFSRYFANTVASDILNKTPRLKQVFDNWRGDDKEGFLSQLEKNQELKSTLLQETPWLMNGLNETEQRRNLALLFNINQLKENLSSNLYQLQQKQLSNGGFPWYGEAIADRYTTQQILAGLGQILRLKSDLTDTLNVVAMSKKSLAYINEKIIEDAEDKTKSTLTPIEIHAWFAKSYFKEILVSEKIKSLWGKYCEKVDAEWKYRNIYEQGMIAVTMLRGNKLKLATIIKQSLLERAQQNNELGMYWVQNQSGCFWYQSPPVETQALLIAFFKEAGNQEKEIEEMKIALLRNKQTNHWGTSKATTAACFVLLDNQTDNLITKHNTEIKVSNRFLSELKPDKIITDIGYVKANWQKSEIKPFLGKVTVTNKEESIFLGAIYWQYLEETDKIKESLNKDLSIERNYFIKKNTPKGELLVKVDKKNIPVFGDEIKVVMYLNADRDYEYVHLKDMRPSGTEPDNELSQYTFQGNLYYYQTIKDVSTNFFINYLKKGRYVLEYSLRVTQQGNFSTGICSVQSMYAPEFGAHSKSENIKFTSTSVFK